MRFIKVVFLAVGVILATLRFEPVWAQTGEGQGVVREIVVEGTRRIEADTVLSYLLIKVGDPFDEERMDRSLKSLFRTGLFSDVTLRREGDKLIVHVVENPIINRVAFEGNKKIEDKDLAAEIQLRPRVVYTRTKVQNDVKRILDLYRASGRFAATVDPKVIPLPENRVDLVFEINEGDVTRVRRISFIGNRVFSDSELRGVIRTKETAFWRILTTDDNYDPDRLEFDKELLRKFYLAHGYADFRVVSTVAELTPDRKDFFITFTVDEGPRYKFGKINITTNIRGLNTEKLTADIHAAEGGWYNADLVEKTIDSLTDALGTLGYAFAEVRPVTRRHRKERTIDVTFDIREGPRVFVERVEISGNTRTRDEVIRREMRLAEGDAFNTSKIRLSRRRIQNLGFFEKVKIENVPGSAPDRTIVKVNVAEKSTGQLTLGAGFSTQEGVLGTVGVRESNFMGRGQDVGVAFTLSQRTQEIDLSFTEPYLFGRNLSGGIDLFRVTQNFNSEGSFDQRKTGFRLRSGYELVDFLRQSWRYSLRADSIRDVDEGASRIVKREKGDTLKSSIGQTLSYDRRDNRFDPTAGYFAKLETDVAGLGGSERFVRTKVSGATYYTPFEDITFSLLAEAGNVTGFGKDVGLSDRFFIGGDNLRGFAFGGVGPRDKETDDALGANNFYVASLEVAFPVGLPKAFGIRGRVFTDLGSSFGIDQSDPVIADRRSLRLSAGFGLSWRSPFGPVRADIGVALLKESFDDTQLLRFNFGTRF